MAGMRKIDLSRLARSMPWLKSKDVVHHTTRIFKSGNSLAVRIPAGTALSAGMEMALTVEDGQILSIEPLVAPKRKFDIVKVAGSARDLQFIDDADRSFLERAPVTPPQTDHGSAAE